MISLSQMMSAQSDPSKEDPRLTLMRSQPRALEINPHSPLIRGLLTSIIDNGANEGLEETMQTLLDVTLLRSGFNVADTGT